MNVLFICKWNVGRSPIAEVLFNKYSKKNKAASTGTHAQKYAGVKLSEVSPYVIKCMKEWKFELSNHTQTPLTKEQVDQADKIFVMTEKEDLPVCLQNSNKVNFWVIEDRAGKDYKSHIEMRNQIDKLVKQLVNEIG